MALEVLAGPYPLDFEGAAVYEFFNVGGESVTWIQGLGLYCGVIFPTSSLTARACVAQIDGTTFERSTVELAQIVVDLRGGTSLAYRSVYSLFNLNYLAGNYDLTPFYTAPGGAFIADIRVICEDRFLKFSGAVVQSSPLYDGVNWTTEYTFASPTFGAQGATVSRGRGPYEICIAANNGQIRFYDTAAKTQAGAIRYIGESPDACVYVPKWDVFVEVKSLNIKVLADAPRPASISTPTFATAPKAGYVSSATAQVLGSQGEPCAGELVNWSITAGGGSLESTQSATDENGNASVNYLAPVGLTGSVTLAAAINF